MNNREILKALYTDKANLDEDIYRITKSYIKDLEDKPGIFITDHAIVRYIERIKGIKLAEGVTDQEKLKRFYMPAEQIRAEMLSLKEDRFVLTKKLKYYRRTSSEQINYGYVIEGLTIVTVIIDD